MVSFFVTGPESLLISMIVLSGLQLVQVVKRKGIKVSKDQEMIVS